jgi:hypothetical protein
MRTLRQLFAAVVLVTMFTLPALAGDITTMIVPPSSAIAGDMHTGVAGEISTGNAEADTAGGSVTDAALALIQSALSLF